MNVVTDPFVVAAVGFKSAPSPVRCSLWAWLTSCADTVVAPSPVRSLRAVLAATERSRLLARQSPDLSWGE